jgi:hypothetical protein
MVSPFLERMAGSVRSVIETFLHLSKGEKLMSHNSIIRLGGLVGLLAAGVSILFNLLKLAGLVPAAIDDPRAMVTLLLIIFALFAIYARQAHKAGILGLLGLALTVTALVFNIAFRYVATFIIPPLASGYEDAFMAAFSGPINTFIMSIFLLLPIGYLLLGVATYRAGILSRWAALLIILGPVINFVGVMSPAVSTLGGLLTNIAIAWLSYSLLAETRETVSSMAKASPAV